MSSGFFRDYHSSKRVTERDRRFTRSFGHHESRQIRGLAASVRAARIVSVFGDLHVDISTSAELDHVANVGCSASDAAWIAGEGGVRSKNHSILSIGQ